MHEQLREIEIPTRPAEFQILVDQAAKKLNFKIFKAKFDIEVSRTQNPDGNEHRIIKPVQLTELVGLSDPCNPLFVLKGEGLAYAVKIREWGGTFSEEGDQTLYTDIELFKLKSGENPEELKRVWYRSASELSSLRYYNEQSWVAGIESDRLESEKSRITTENAENDPLFKEILSRVNQGSTI